MAYPDKYARRFGFQQYQDSHPATPAPGDEHDSELDDIAARLGVTIDFMKTALRSDGKLANGSVGIDQLAKDLAIGFHEPTTWVSGGSYSVNDTVFHLDGFYQCKVPHVATDTFNPDYWVLLVDFSTQMSAAAQSAASAATSEANAAGSATAAATSEANAAGSATAAATSEANAAASATILAGNVQKTFIMPRTVSASLSDSLGELTGIPSAIQIIETRGYYAPGDGGGASYARRAAQPANPGYFLVDGVYWEIIDVFTRPEQFGCKGDGVADDSAALQAFFTGGAARKVGMYPGAATYDTRGVSITVPDNSYVRCHPQTLFQRSADPSGGYTHGPSDCQLILGNNVDWEGGASVNTTVTATSTTSFTIGSGSTTFTTQAGLSVLTGAFLRVYSRANAQNAIEGAVTAYNSSTGSCTIAAPFPTGSGTHSDWNINLANSWHAPLVLHNVSGTRVKGFKVSGNWYVGLLMEADQHFIAGVLTTNCTFEDCEVTSAQNRAFYLYGSVTESAIKNCRSFGHGITNYSFNLNAANASGSLNAIDHNNFIGCLSDSALFQGFECGDNAHYNTFSACDALGATNAASSGCGFLNQKANAGIPQNNKFSSCSASGCDNGFEFSGAFFAEADDIKVVGCGYGVIIQASAGTECNYVTVSGKIENCSLDGIHVNNSSVRCDLDPLRVLNCTGYGVVIAVGAQYTRGTGRSFNNTAGNVNDASSGGSAPAVLNFTTS